MCLADASFTFDTQFFHPASFGSVGTDVEICRYPLMERAMNLKNVLMVGPKDAFGDLGAQPELLCKLVSIDDGFKALLGLVKLAAKNTPLAGIYIHEATGRVELPMYVDIVHSILEGLGIQSTPITIGMREPASISHQFSQTDVRLVELPIGENSEDRMESWVSQVNAFVHGESGAS